MGKGNWKEPQTESTWAQLLGVWHQLSWMVNECWKIFSPGKALHSLLQGRTELFWKRPLHTQRHDQFSNSKGLPEERKELVKGMRQDWIKCGWEVMLTNSHITQHQFIWHKHLGLLERGNVWIHLVRHSGHWISLLQNRTFKLIRPIPLLFPFPP